MQYQDHNKILDFIEKVPDKTILLDIPLEEKQFPWETLLMYKDKINLILGLHNLHLVEIFKLQNFQWYWPYPINTFDELQEIIKLNPSYILLGSPLCFNLDKVYHITNIPIRLTANVAYEPYIPRDNGVCGRYIRPEDITHYETYVTTLEFIEPDLNKEATLLHIYKEAKEWPGNLNLLIKHLNYDVNNRTLPTDFASRRMNCGQRCKENNKCKFCYLAFEYANAVRKDFYRHLLNAN